MHPVSHKQTISCSEVCPPVTKSNTSICCQDLLLWSNNSCSETSNLIDKIWVRGMGQRSLHNRRHMWFKWSGSVVDQCLQTWSCIVASTHFFLIEILIIVLLGALHAKWATSVLFTGCMWTGAPGWNCKKIKVPASFFIYCSRETSITRIKFNNT